MVSRAISALSDKVRQLYARSHAADWGLSEAAWAAIVQGICAKYCQSENEIATLLSALRGEDLALARGCAAGNERAWDAFMHRFRPKLYEIARGITRDESRGRELADSVYAELFGTDVRDGKRRSKLDHYSGRGSLEGWLRTVLAQEWVNRFRKAHREVSLDEQQEAGVQYAAPTATAATAPSSDLARATDAALSALTSEEKYILAAYHLDGRKLADIAKTLGVHESTISRRVEKIVAQVRSGIIKQLQKQGLSRAQIEEAMAVDAADLDLDLRERLAHTAPRNLSRSGLQADAASAFSRGEEPKPK